MTIFENYSPWIRYDLKEWGPLTDPKYLIRLKGKTVLYNQEEDISNIYIVKSGRVRLSYFTSDGAEKIYKDLYFRPDRVYVRRGDLL